MKIDYSDLPAPARVVVADPAWPFSDKLPGDGRGAEKHYSTMTVGDICAFPLPPLADDAYLFMWRVSAMPEEAYQVVRAWGFVPKSEVVWEKLTKNGKPHFGMGRHVRSSHETCILAVRGKPKPLVRNARSRFAAPVGRHSEKPAVFFDLYPEALSNGPYVELFARTMRPGWHCYGNEVHSER